MLIGILASAECTVVVTGGEPELGGSCGADRALYFSLFSHSFSPCSDIPSLNNFIDVCILSFTYKSYVSSTASKLISTH